MQQYPRRLGTNLLKLFCNGLLEWKVPPKDPTDFTVSEDLLPFLANEQMVEIQRKNSASEKPSPKQDDEK